MVDIIQKSTSDIRLKSDIRDGMLKLEEYWKSEEGHTVGDDWVDRVEGGELEHQFVEGLYIRKVHLPKGMVCTSKIHAKRHPFFILKGKIRILSEEGVVELQAPYHGITEAGTKRLVYVLEDCIWYTLHATDKTTPEEVEDEVIAKDFGEIELTEQEKIELIRT